jgi:hypothetical protein
MKKKRFSLGCNLGMSDRESDGDLTVKARDF